MTERKRKRNTRTLKAREGFQISRKPVVRFAADDRSRDAADSVGLPRAYGPPILFGIARDSCCIFTGWNIDWLSVFEKAMPVDRQVHLRVYRADGLEEKSMAVEPMTGMHYVTMSEPQGSYRLDIGYYQPADVWHSVAMSNEIAMPPDGIAETVDVDLVTIPFHLSFQQLVDLLRPANDTELATVISQFQKRALSSEERTRLSPEEKRILRTLDVSLSDIAAARRAFDRADSEKLARRAGALITFGPSSPSRGFESDWILAGS
ncbi:MAG: DUF4912 domain-containing protein [Candidatus Udaeobacter sp.]